MSITNHKYWQARLDGEPVTVWPANLAYQALIVPGGRYRVELFYRNPLIVPCMAVTMASLLVASGLIARDVRRSGRLS
ncbi:MAG TPA: hypothetical protein VHL58_01245 [Thermoanaerobaculia bacterium]|nr:hypothetical protein [Thermoanaerobaculia bacterium]